MPCVNSLLAQNIAKHKVHDERVIAKIKTFKIISHRVPTSQEYKPGMDCMLSPYPLSGYILEGKILMSDSLYPLNYVNDLYW